jgi:hypothetical protein
MRRWWRGLMIAVVSGPVVWRPGDPLGLCAPCVARSVQRQAVALVEGTGMCAPHVQAALAKVSGSGPLVDAVRSAVT